MQILKVEGILKADTFLRRLKGYMFKDAPKRSEILIIEPCNQIHTFNMRFDLDVLFLDDEYRVVKKYLGIKPGKVLKSVKSAKLVVEAKAGLFNNIRENERIRFDL